MMNISKINEQDLGIDPLQGSITSPAFAAKLFRRNYMKPNTIGVLGRTSINNQQKISNCAMQWLKYISCKENVRIQHGLNGKEIQCGKYFIDGLDQENKLIYEFNGKFKKLKLIIIAHI